MKNFIIISFLLFSLQSFGAMTASSCSGKVVTNLKEAYESKGKGLAGIEVYSPKHTDKQTETYYEMTNKCKIGI